MVQMSSIGKVLTPKNTIVGVVVANMVCRPLITLSNKELPPETKRYTATREFCTEFFGLINTLTIGSLIEWGGKKLAAKKILKDKPFTPELEKTIKNTGWDALENMEKNGKIFKGATNLKGSIIATSFLGAALVASTITPVMNNIILNKVINKISGKKSDKKHLATKA